MAPAELTTQLLIQSGASTVGYLRWQLRQPEPTQDDSTGSTVWIELLIGSDAHRGKGIAPKVLMLVAHRFLPDRHIGSLNAAPAKRNVAARRALEKAGFVLADARSRSATCLMVRDLGRERTADIGMLVPSESPLAASSP